VDFSNSGAHGIRTWIFDIEQLLESATFLEQIRPKLL
jgi:hypothetical protein